MRPFALITISFTFFSTLLSQIDAFDNGPIQQKSRLTLLLTVIDPVEPSSLAPEFIPFFADLLYENVAPGMFVTTVDAFDADTDSNDIVYSITGESNNRIESETSQCMFCLALSFVGSPVEGDARRELQRKLVLFRSTV